MVLRNRSNIGYPSSQSCVHCVSPSLHFDLYSGLGRRVVGVVLTLLLLLSGDIETNPGPVGRQLTVDDLRVVMEELNCVCAKWYNVGLHLGVGIATLDAIKKQCLSDPPDCLRETFMTWLQTCPSSPTWNNIVDALRSSIVGEARLAEDLEKKYCSTQDIAATHQHVPPVPPAQVHTWTTPVPLTQPPVFASQPYHSHSPPWSVSYYHPPPTSYPMSTPSLPPPPSGPASTTQHIVATHRHTPPTKGPVGNKLTLDDLGRVMEEVLDVSAQWFHLGLQLKVKIGTLDRIQAQFSAHRDQLREMLKTWLTTSDNSSWKTLTEALRSRSVGASQLASVLETKYCPVETRFPFLPLPPTPSHIPQSPTVTMYPLFPTPTHTDTSKGEMILGMPMSMTPSEKIQLLGKHSGDTQLETPSSKHQRKSYISHPWIVEPQKSELFIDPSYSTVSPSHVAVHTIPAVTHYTSEELPLMRKAHVSGPTTVVKVEDQVQYFDSEFRSLVNKAYQEVNGKVKPSDFLYRITCLPVSTRTQHRSFIEEKLTNIPVPAAIESIWTILNLYWDFLNYGLLEQVINVCGSEGLKHQMLEYVLELSKFKQTTRICDFIESWPSRRYGQVDSLKKVVVMMQMEWSQCTLHDLESFNIDLVHKFFLPDFDIQLEYLLRRGIDVDRGRFPPSFPVADDPTLLKTPPIPPHPPTPGPICGVEVIGATEFMVPNQGGLFEWKGYGLRLQVPAGSLPPGMGECRINIRMSLSGQFQLPEDSDLLSPVFWISAPCKFTRPITLEIQHCALREDETVLGDLSYVSANCSQRDLPYWFRKVDGGVFTKHSSYGSIQLSHFSGKAVIGRKGGPRSYCAHLYHKIKQIYDWRFYLVITQNIDAQITAVKCHYDHFAEWDTSLKIGFQKSEITLDIPEGLQEGWKIVPMSHPSIARKEVDEFREGQWIPHCELMLEWKIKDEMPERLQYKVKLNGARAPKDFFQLVLDPAEGIVPGKSSNLCKPEMKDLMDALYHTVADKWEHIGIYLHLPMATLKAISDKQQHDPHKCLVEMLGVWLKRLHPPATWSAIIEAVEFLGEEQLGRELREKH